MDLLRSDQFEGEIIGDKWLYFELMDRAHVLCSHIDSAFLDHPGLDEEHSAMVAKAAALIGEVYQWAGRKIEEVDRD